MVTRYSSALNTYLIKKNHIKTALTFKNIFKDPTNIFFIKSFEAHPNDNDMLLVANPRNNNHGLVQED